jgi:hypothetical protein
VHPSSTLIYGVLVELLEDFVDAGFWHWENVIEEFHSITNQKNDCASLS